MKLAAFRTGAPSSRVAATDQALEGEQMHKAISLILLVVTASLFVPACGGDSEGDALSKSEYIARSNAICKRTAKKAEVQFRRIVGAEKPRRGEEQRYLSNAQRFLRTAAIPIISENLDDRRALAAPKGDEEEIQAIIAAGDKAIAGFERIAADQSRVEALFRGRTRDPATEFDARSKRYGIESCGGDQS
jgi:hypothetical protein